MISLIIPAFNEEKNLAANIDVVISFASQTGHAFEIILVDDGSVDRTWEEIVKIAERHDPVMGLRLSRNFGKESAMFAGLRKSKGDAVIVLDSDLQHPPDLIPEMVASWERDKFLIVDTVKKDRKGQSFMYSFSANIFNGVMERLTRLNLKNSNDYKLMDRRIVDQLLQLNEYNTFFRGMVTWIGFPRKVIEFELPKRKDEPSKFSVWALTRLALNSILSFSNFPLYLISGVGFAFLAFAVIGSILTLVRYISGTAVAGFTTVILLLLFIGSLILLSVGVVGLYTAKIFEEVKNRPRYVIQEEVN